MHLVRTVSNESVSEKDGVVSLLVSSEAVHNGICHGTWSCTIDADALVVSVTAVIVIIVVHVSARDFADWSTRPIRDHIAYVTEID